MRAERFELPASTFMVIWLVAARNTGSAVFNGQGLLAASTTNEVEVSGKVRFSPWRNSSNSFLKGFSFGGAAEHSRSKGLGERIEL